MAPSDRKWLERKQHIPVASHVLLVLFEELPLDTEAVFVARPGYSRECFRQSFAIRFKFKPAAEDL